MKYWLKEDVVGPVSRRVYGQYGDRVEYVSDDGVRAVVKGKELFHVRLELLSDKPLKKMNLKKQKMKRQSQHRRQHLQKRKVAKANRRKEIQQLEVQPFFENVMIATGEEINGRSVLILTPAITPNKNLKNDKRKN
jgi:hypothetical protein